jgi:hypothetical protein
MLQPFMPSSPKLKNVSADLAPLNVIRTETVLSRLPIHNLSKRGEVNIHITKYNERGELELNWDVSHSKKFGDARQLAFQLDTLIIDRRIDELGRPLPKVIRLESLRQICKELGLRSRSGDNTKSLKKALHQNAGAYIIAKLRYKARDGTERLLEAGFTRYSVVFTGERLPDGSKADGVYLILNEPYWEVLNNAPTRPLDYDYLKQLPPTAQRFYQIISYKIFAALKFKHSRAKLLYSEYCTYSAQQRYYDFDHVKKQMYKVHKPHLVSGYLTKVQFEATTDSDGKPDWVMSYIPGPKARAEFKAFNGKHAKDSDTFDQEQVLPLEKSEDSTSDDARRLVQYFHKRFHDTDIVPPAPKDLEFAGALIAQYGTEKSRFVVEYTQEAAAATKYSPDMLIGIRKYVDAAIKKFDAREKHRQEEKRKAREEELQIQYERYRDHEIKRIKSSLSSDELAEMESTIRIDLKAEGIKQFAHGLETSRRMDKQLAARAGVLPYEKWRAQQTDL